MLLLQVTSLTPCFSVCDIDQSTSTCKMSCLTLQSARRSCCQAAIGSARNCYTEFKNIYFVGSTVELQLSGLIGTVLSPDVQKIRIIGFFFENRLHWPLEVLKKISTNSCFRLHIYLRNNKKLINNSLYVFDILGKILSNKKM